LRSSSRHGHRQSHGARVKTIRALSASMSGTECEHANTDSGDTVDGVPLVAADHISHAFGHLPLLDDVSVSIERGERVAIIGRNGGGKSTLLQLLDGTSPPDRGSIRREPGTRVARLVQDVPLSDTRSVFDVVADGLGDLRDLVRAYHAAVAEVAAGGAHAV